MRILYHLTILPPKLPKAEAFLQEISALQSRFEGELIYLNPNQQSPVYLPRLVFGFQKLRELRAKEANLSLHHFYNPDPFPFPVLRYLRRPTLYTISSGLGRKRPNVKFFNSLAAVVVADERSFKRLRSWGVNNSVLVQPGVDTTRFTHVSMPLQSKIRLMVGSAPWTRGQFRTKGVDALLETAQQFPNLHLTFLWRGVLADEMSRRVARFNVGNQVTVLNRQVDVNRVLANVHASIVLAAEPGIVKAYPHSLLDSLAAGKPVLVSQAIPMADYVRKTGCGEVVEAVSPASILQAIEAMTHNYDVQQHLARQLGQRDFSQQAMLASYQQLYRQLLVSEE